MGWRRRRALTGLDDDMRDHLAREIDENLARGMTPDEARRQAHRAFGNVRLAKDDTRAVWMPGWIETLVQDVRYGWRTLRRAPGFACAIVLTLALGIGANTAVYSFFEAILLRPLPVAEPDSLVIMKWRARSYALARTGMSWSTGGSWSDEATGTSISSIFPYPALEVFQGAGSVLTTAFGYFIDEQIAVSVGDRTDAVIGHYVSGTYFEGIGVAPVAGRLIQAPDDRDGMATVAVISDRFSRRRFGAPQAAVGRTIRVNDRPFVVVGVAPPGFFGAEPGAVPDVYLPMRAQLVMGSWRPSHLLDPHYYWVEVMGRLRPGVSLAQAQAVLARRFELFAAGTASSDEERGDLPRLHLESGAGGLDSIRRQYAHALLVLVSLVAVLLLIACSNIASLLIARTAARRQEIGIRLSLGSSRSRVIRQLLTESLVLSLAGGALGIAIAWSSIRGMTVLLSSGREHFTLHAELNASVLAMTFGISVLCGMLFGLAPALQGARASIAPFLKDRRGGPTFVRTRSLDLRHGLLVAQIALSLVLLVTAGLFGRTLSRLHGIELGFARDNILLFTIRPSSAGYGGPALTALYENVRARLAALPGVEAVSLSVRPLPAGGGSMAPIDIAGSPERSRDDSRRRSAALTTVGPDFFATMRMPLAAGREFTERDVAGSARVVVVNRAMARLFGLENPVGRTLTFNDAPYEIVGLVDDALAFFLKEERRPIVYFSYLQNTRAPGQMTYELRTAGPPGELATAVRELVRGVDSRLAIHDLKTQADHVDQAISMEIVLAKLCSMFAALALAIAAVGIYGTVAFNVARRTTEIGIRMALGARSGRVMWMVQRDVLLTAAAAFAVGLPLAMIVSRAVESLLYGIRPADPVSIGLGVGAVLGCALTAGFVPARRAARIDPVSAIRSE